MKQNTWIAVVAALLAVGVLIGAVVWLGKGSTGSGGGGNGGSVIEVPSGGTTAKPSGSTEKPAETSAEVKRKTVVTNATAEYAYRENATSGKVAYFVYSDKLKPNTKYSIAFNFAESDHQSFVSTNGLTFQYTIALQIPTAGDFLGDNLVVDGGMKVGLDYDFETDENGTAVFCFLKGSIPSGDSAAKLAKYTEICHYIRDNMPFQISEIVG